MTYIVTNCSSVFSHRKWTMIDSLDGVRYETFGDALQQCKILDAHGVVELVEGTEDEETGNDQKD
jgi:hypothetical protein